MKKQLVILTGPSGTGISSARYVFEELGYFITENAPSRLTREILKDFAKSDFKTEYFCLMVGISVAKRVYEDAIKEELSVTSRCIPFEQETIADTCVWCGKPAKKMLYWGRAY